MENCGYLFVYGTLLRRSSHPMARFLEEHADFVSDATTAGRLYDLGPYPALLVAALPTDIVHGELFRLRDLETTLEELDVYEGLGVSAPLDWPFQRRVGVAT